MLAHSFASMKLKFGSRPCRASAASSAAGTIFRARAGLSATLVRSGTGLNFGCLYSESVSWQYVG